MGNNDIECVEMIKHKDDDKFDLIITYITKLEKDCIYDLSLDSIKILSKSINQVCENYENGITAMPSGIVL